MFMCPKEGMDMKIQYLEHLLLSFAYCDISEVLLRFLCAVVEVVQ